MRTITVRLNHDDLQFLRTWSKRRRTLAATVRAAIAYAEDTDYHKRTLDAWVNGKLPEDEERGLCEAFLKEVAKERGLTA